MSDFLSQTPFGSTGEEAYPLSSSPFYDKSHRFLLLSHFKISKRGIIIVQYCKNFFINY